MDVTAAVMLGPGRMEVQRFERPSPPRGSMLLRVVLAGVCGTDLHVYQGHMRNIPFPIIPGHEILGRVEEMGEGAEAMEGSGQPLGVGDRVAVVPTTPCGQCWYCRNLPGRPNLCANRIARAYGYMSCKDPPHLLGGYAEYLFVKPGSVVYRVPDGVPDEVAVLSEPTSVATRTLERAYAPGLPTLEEGLGIGKTLLIQGAGPLGLVMILVARAAGVGTIIAVDAEERRLEKAGELGADHTLNVTQSTREERLGRVLELTNGVGADIVVEAAGVPQAFSEALDYVRRGGKLVEAGHFTDSGETTLRPHTICFKDVDILGVWASPHHIVFKTVMKLFRTQAARLPFHRVVSHRFRVEEGEKALEEMRNKRVIKAVIAP